MKMALGRACTADSLKALGRLLTTLERNCLAAASTLLSSCGARVQVNVVRRFIFAIILILPLVFDQFSHPSESLVHVDLILQAKLI